MVTRSRTSQRNSGSSCAMIINETCFALKTTMCVVLAIVVASARCRTTQIRHKSVRFSIFCFSLSLSLTSHRLRSYAVALQSLAVSAMGSLLRQVQVLLFSFSCKIIFENNDNYRFVLAVAVIVCEFKRCECWRWC